MAYPLPGWARAHGPALCAGRIRTEPGDFVVEEILELTPAGTGEHDLLQVRKTAANTAWAARQLAAHAGVREVDIGYGGLKDRHAVATQWFSVRRPNKEGTDWTSFAAEGIEILHYARHNRKLKRGSHAGNRFRILVRTTTDDANLESKLAARLVAISAAGVPNYFGEQRFGRDGANIPFALDVLAGQRTTRNKKSIALSAARAYLFNAILDRRVRKLAWNKLLLGERANLDGSASVFDVDDITMGLVSRCAEGDIHPTGSLWGQGAPLSCADVAELERDVIANFDTLAPDLAAGLEARGVAAASRPLRLRVDEFQHSLDPAGVLLSFRLAKGGYATTVLRELFDIE